MPLNQVNEKPAPYKKPAKPQVQRPDDVFTFCRAMSSHRQEVFRVILLDGRHRLLRNVIAIFGTIDAAHVHPRDVFRDANRRNAAAVVLVHNHPSGDPQPSRNNIELTRRLASVGAIIGVFVLDHVIIAKQGFVSLREHGGPFDGSETEPYSSAASRSSCT